MIDNGLFKNEFYKKLVNYLYLNNYISISECEILFSRCDFFNGGFDKCSISVDIEI